MYTLLCLPCLIGALDLTEEVGAAVGIPHVSQIWEEVHRTHSCTAYEEEQESEWYSYSPCVAVYRVHVRVSQMLGTTSGVSTHNDTFHPRLPNPACAWLNLLLKYVEGSVYITYIYLAVF